MDDEARLMRKFAHDLDAYRRRRRDTRAGVGAVGLEQLQEGVIATGYPDQRHSPLAVLHVDGMHPAVRACDRKYRPWRAAFAFGCLAGIVAARVTRVLAK